MTYGEGFAMAVRPPLFEVMVVLELVSREGGRRSDSSMQQAVSDREQCSTNGERARGGGVGGEEAYHCKG